MNKIEELVKEIAPVKEERPKTYTAEVSHADEEGVVWVRLPGAEQDTPTASTSTDVKMGDTVTVEWRNNRLYIAGNYTNPSAGVERVVTVEKNAQAGIEEAQLTADEALSKANKQVQYFWTDADGAHVTTVPKETFLDNPTGGNALFDSNSVEFKDGSASLAEFGANGARVGKTSGAHTSIGASGMQVYKDAATQLANIGYGSGNAESGTAIAPYYSLGLRTATGASDIGNYSMAEGYNTKASGSYSHAEGHYTKATNVGDHAEGFESEASGGDSHVEGWWTTASGSASHAEGSQTTASGNNSHAEGRQTTASGSYSHAEGASTTAQGDYSHAEGQRTTASGSDSHTEGASTTASGHHSHAEGASTTAQGDYSHAQNRSTIAGYEAQTAIGKYNDNQQNNAFEIGNGESENARSNAFEVDWDGNTTAAGTITVEGHSSPIGTRLTGERESTAGTATTSYTTAAHIDLTAGTWLITGYNSFNGGTAGRRAILITGSSTATYDAAEGSASGYAAGSMHIALSTAITVSITSNATYYLRIKSASQVDSPNGNLAAVRIA